MAGGPAAAAQEPVGGAGEWARRYPPLLTMLVALILAVVVLPSSLNLPQTNPTQTLEFAPVPPDDKNDNQQGNTSALGAGDSSTIGADGLGGDGNGPTKPPPPEGKGAPVDDGTECVGKPPRQTFDPLSPPCVPSWDDSQDNGGATYLGVTATEVRLLIYLDGAIDYIQASDSGNRNAPSKAVYDLGETEAQCQAHTTATTRGGCTHLTVRAARVWQEYFNKRFQTYGRYVHVFVYFSGGANETERRQDAAEAFSQIEPFGVVSLAQGAEEAFLDGMARHGVLNFGSFAPREREFFDEFPRQIWSYLPSAAQLTDDYGSYVCQKVIGPDPAHPYPAVMADPTLNGQPRKLAMLYTTSQNWPGLRSMAATVRDRVEGCRGVITDTATYKNCCLARQGGSVSPAAQQKMESLRQQGVTTILWTGGVNGEFAKAAASIGYFPEWIVLGDSVLDAHHPIRLSDSSPSFDGHAVVISPQPYKPSLEQQRCFAAFREVNATYSNSDFQYTCDWYDDLFQFFTGVQVAGPYLGPTQMDKGFRAIPQRYVGRPDVPACFYPVGDYTCIKDAQALYWNASDVPPGDERPGCWKAIESGKRYAAEAWPPGNINAQIDGTEPCTTYDKRVQFAYA